MDATGRSKHGEWFCPSLGGEISRKECASKRVSLIQCAANCEHNPFGFANYSQLRELEGRWFDHALRRARSIGATPRPHPFRGSGNTVFQELAEVQFVMTALLGNGPMAANTPFEQWAADPSAALSNDARLLTRFRAKTRATVVEIQRSQARDACTAIDVFEPDNGEFVIFHPSLSKTPRYSRHFGWFTWFPHFVHPLGHMVELVPHIWFPWKEEVGHELRNRQNMDYSMTLQKFLREYFCQAVELVGVLAHQWEKDTETIGPGRHYSAVYAVVDKISTVAARFESHPSCASFMVLPNHPTYGRCQGEYRFRIRGSSEELQSCSPYMGSEKDGPNERTIGMFSLYDKVLLFHCDCRRAFDLGRKLLDEDFQGLLRFNYEDILDVAANLLQSPTLVLQPLPLPAPMQTPRGRRNEEVRNILDTPPELTVQLEPFQQLVRAHHDRTFANFLDRPHLFLDNKTPREASRSSEDRAHLVDLMKIALYELDVRNRQFQLDLNVTPILRELSLQELI